MYLEYFGLTRRTFDKDIKAHELFPSKNSVELENRLKYLLTLKGIGLITGDVGSGKTTICRKVISELHSGLYKVFYVCLTTGNVMDVYKSIAWEMGLSTERSLSTLYKAIKDEIQRLCLEAKQQPILIIDEAQYLRNEILINLRLLTNYEMDSKNRLCLILIGQAELRRRLTMGVHEPLWQRIIVNYHLSGLQQNELLKYLEHHLKLAGTERNVFEPSAVEAIFQATNGLPRKINLLAHYILNAVVLGVGNSANSDHVRQAHDEIS